MTFRVFEPSFGSEKVIYQPLAALRIRNTGDGIEVAPPQIGRIAYQDVQALSVFEHRPRGTAVLSLMLFSRGRPRPFVIDLDHIDYAEFPALATVPTGMEKFRRLLILLGQAAAGPTLVDDDTAAYLKTAEVVRIRKLLHPPLFLANAFANQLAETETAAPPPAPPLPRALAATPRNTPQVAAVPQAATPPPPPLQTPVAAPQAPLAAPHAPQAGMPPQAPPSQPEPPPVQATAPSSPQAAPPAAAGPPRPIRRVRPNFFRIVFGDTLAFLCPTFIAVSWVLVILTANGIVFTSRSGTEVGSSTFGLVLAVVVTVVCVPLFIQRIRLVNRIFQKGRLCTGTITSVNFFRDRGRVEYQYVINRRTYNGGTAVMKNKRTKALQAGQEVDLVVDPNNRRRAFIMALYN